MSIDPLTLATIGKVIAGVSTVVGAVGNLSASQYNAAVSERNAKAMDENAKRLAEKAQQDIVDSGNSAAMEKGQILAAAGASGIDALTGSSSLQMAALKRLAQRDATRIAQGSTTDINAAKQGAADLRFQASQTRKGGMLNLFGDLAGGLHSYISDSLAIKKAQMALEA